MFTFCVHDNYFYQAIDTNGCSCIVYGSVEQFQPLVQHLSTGTAFQNQAGHITLYPNPTSGLLYMQVTQPQEISHAALYDVTGRTVISEVDYATGEVHLKGLAPGQYTLVVNLTGGSTERYRVILVP